MCVCVCVCVRERERERDREPSCVCECEVERGRERKRDIIEEGIKLVSNMLQVMSSFIERAFCNNFHKWNRRFQKTGKMCWDTENSTFHRSSSFENIDDKKKNIDDNYYFLNYYSLSFFCIILM